MAVTACTGPVQTHAKLNPSMGQEVGHKFPPLAEELLAIVDFWEKETKFSLGMQPLRGYPGSSTWLYIHTHTVNLSGLSRLRDRRIIGGRKCGTDLM